MTLVSTQSDEGGTFRGWRQWWITTVVTLFLGALTVGAQTFTTSFSEPYLQVGQPGMLSLTFVGAPPDRQPPIPRIDGAEISFNTTSRSWQNINGVSRVQFDFIHIVVPSRPGELVVPEMSILVNGQPLTAPAITIEVLTAEEAAAAEQERLKELAFIRVQLPKEQAYVGEVIPAEIKVYTIAADNLQLHQFKAEGFTLGKASHTSQSRETVNGQSYYVVTFHMPIAARKIGTLPVGPAECTLNVYTPTRTGVGGLRSSARSLRITSEVAQIEILPLPTEDVPPDFNGAVGQFSMRVAASPTNLPAGDPITYTVQVQATGTLDDLKLPEQNGWREFRTYPAESTILQKGPLGLSGLKQFEQIVIPLHAEIRELPPFRFSFFDPQQRRYRTLTQPAIPLTVQPSTAQTVQPSFVGAGPGAANEASEERVDDIAHIEPRIGSTVPGALLLRSPWFYVLQLLPIVGWIGLLLHRRRQRRLAQDPRLIRRRRVARLVQSGLKELALHAERGESDVFFETTLRLLKEQIGERLDLPAVSITEDVIDEHLQPMGLSEPDRERLHSLFQNCNHARYAGDISAAGLHHTKAELEAILTQLQQLPGK